MDASERKRLLKAAREAIGQKAYQDCLASCKEILKQDKSCYEAYIFVGKAAFHLQEYQQAEAAYTRATGLDANNPLAWQGLAELHADTGAWDKAAAAYSTLAQLCCVWGADAAMQAKGAGFLRRAAEAATRCGDLDVAQQSWRQLLAAAAPDSPDRLGLLCHLADVLLQRDQQQLGARVHQYLAQAQVQGLEVSEAAAYDAVEGEWAAESLEAGGSGGTVALLRDITASTPPSPAYAVYHEALVHRLRNAVHAASPGSMERHNRRAAALAAAHAAMDGGQGLRPPGGCCTAVPFEVSLAILEVEAAVVAGGGTAHAGTASLALRSSNSSIGDNVPLQDMEQVAKRLAHAFPWNPTAGVHLSLCMRRRGGPSTVHTEKPASSGAADSNVTDLNAGNPGGTSPQCRLLPPGVRRRRLIKGLLGGLRQGGSAGSSVAGWLAASQLLLEEGAAEAALDAAKQGLGRLAARDLLGHEALGAADLLLTLAAGHALAARAGVSCPGPTGYVLQPTQPAALQQQSAAAGEAEAWLGGLLLSGRVAGSCAGFAQLAGSDVPSITHEATRSLAQLALVQGDVARARGLYEGLVGAAAMGRGGPTALGPGKSWPWALAEYSALLLHSGENQAALGQSQAALSALTHAPVTGNSAQASLVQASYYLLAARAAWAVGGVHRTERGAHAHAHALAAAKAAEQALSQAGSNTDDSAAAASVAAAAFALLGKWYQECGADSMRAAKCYRRALEVDVTQDTAGAALVHLLHTAGQVSSARMLCEECLSRAPPTSPPLWALHALGPLQLADGDADTALVTLQKAIRTEPGAADLWEALGSAYHAAGRQAAALKAYTRALELSPRRLYCLVQAGVLHYNQGAFKEALLAYDTALQVQPDFLPALLGAAETRLAAAYTYGRMGAVGTAAAELASAEEHARTATRTCSSCVAGWKSLGDAELQHATITPRDVQRTEAAAAAGSGEVQAVVGGLRARMDHVRAAGRAYAHALHLDPSQGLVWGDAGMALHQQALLQDALQRAQATAGTPLIAHAKQQQQQQQAPDAVAGLQRACVRAVRGGLRLLPASDWLWACAGLFAAEGTELLKHGQQGPASNSVDTMLGEAEFCFSRALQLNPKRAATWTALGRLYARMGAPALAQRCFESGRAQEPTLVAVWEAMGHLAGSSSTSVGDAAYKEALDAFEHALGLGGGPESWLGYTEGALMAGHGAEGETFAAAGKAAAQLPLLAGPRVVYGLAAEARSRHADAVRAYTTARALLDAQRICSTNIPDELLPPQLSCSSPAAGLATSNTAGAVTLRAAVSLNLARALARSGATQQALQEFEAVGGADAVAVATQAAGAAPGTRGWPLACDAAGLAAYAHVLKHTGQVPASWAALEAAVAVAAASARTPGLSAAITAGRTRLHMACVNSLAQAYITDCAPARLQDVYALVVGHTCDVAQDAEPRTADLALNCWLSLLAGATLVAQKPGPDAAAAAGLVPDVQAALLGWAAARSALDQAQIHSKISCMQALTLLATWQAAAARVRAAHALHACPWDLAARLHLARAASACGGSHVRAGARAAPRMPSAPTPTSAPGARKLAEPLSSAFGPAQPQHRSPTRTQQSAQDAAQLRANGLLATAAGPAQANALAAEVAWLTRAVHADPQCHATWYLLAMTSLQLAVASGSQSRLFRTALVRCQMAVVHAKRMYAQFEPEAAAAVPPQSAGPAPAPASPPGFSLMGLNPALQLAMGNVMLPPAPTGSPASGIALIASATTPLISTAAAPSPLVLSAAVPLVATAVVPLVAAAGAAASNVHAHQPANDARRRVSMLVLRLLAATSECLLHSRLPRCVEAAKDAATEALRWALQHGLDASLAHRQLARCHAAAHDVPNSAHASAQAIKAGDLLALLDAMCLGTGPEEGVPGPGAEGAYSLAQTIKVKAAGAAPWEQGLVGTATLLCAARLLAVGEAAGARDMLVAAVEGRMVPQDGMAAAHVLQSRAALSLAAGSGEDGSSKRMQLEARWAANNALLELGAVPDGGRLVVLPGAPPGGGRSRAATQPRLSRGPERSTTLGAAATALAEAEAARGRADLALKAAAQAMRAGAAPPAAQLLSFAAGLTASNPSRRVLAAKAVHGAPGDRMLWTVLRSEA